MTQRNKNKLTYEGRKIAQRLLSYQAVVSIILIVLFAVIYGIKGAKTATAGALIYLIPNYIFSLYAFRFGGARVAKQVVRSFYAGEALKMVLTILLFAIAFIFLTEPWLPLFIVFGTLLLMYWFIPFLNLKSN